MDSGKDEPKLRNKAVGRQVFLAQLGQRLKTKCKNLMVVMDQNKSGIVPATGFLQILELNSIKLAPAVARLLVQKTQCATSNPQSGLTISYKDALRMINIDAEKSAKEGVDTFDNLHWIIREDGGAPMAPCRTTASFFTSDKR